MRFNRRLRTFRAISFDLDDTLYSNRPVMEATESAMRAYFAEQLGKKLCSFSGVDYSYWFEHRARILQKRPFLKHDVGELRQAAYFSGLVELGLSKSDALQLAEKAYQHFMLHRCNFVVPENIHSLLSKLSEKWPLVAISNGNVDTRKIGISQYFSYTYHANLVQAQKPEPDMFKNASQALQLPTDQILHIGDCGTSDIYGAIAAGCQSAWVAAYDVGKPISILPDIELNEVTELAVFV